MGFPGGSDGKESACSAGDWGLIPGSGRSPGEGNGNTLQYYCLENPMDRGAMRATVHGVAEWGMTERPTLSLSITLSEDTLNLNLHPYNNVAFFFFLAMPLVLKAWSPNHRTVRKFP